MYLVIQLGDTLISSFSGTWVSKISEGIADADVKRDLVCCWSNSTLGLLRANGRCITCDSAFLLLL